MKFLDNVLISSVILSVTLLITIYYIFYDYELEKNNYIRLFFYMAFNITIFLLIFKNTIIKKYKFEPITAAAEVFNEITDSQHLNGIMPFGGMNEDDEELIIDNIPKSITCNNIA